MCEPCEYRRSDLPWSLENLARPHEQQCRHFCCARGDSLQAGVLLDSWCGLVDNDGHRACGKPLGDVAYGIAANLWPFPVRVMFTLRSLTPECLRLALEEEIEGDGENAWKDVVCVYTDLDCLYQKKGIQSENVNDVRFRFRAPNPGVRLRVMLSVGLSVHSLENLRVPLQTVREIGPICVYVESA